MIKKEYNFTAKNIKEFAIYILIWEWMKETNIIDYKTVCNKVSISVMFDFFQKVPNLTIDHREFLIYKPVIISLFDQKHENILKQFQAKLNTFMEQYFVPIEAFKSFSIKIEIIPLLEEEVFEKKGDLVDNIFNCFLNNLVLTRSIIEYNNSFLFKSWLYCIKFMLFIYIKVYKFKKKWML
jgi:hypothetical protein